MAHFLCHLGCSHFGALLLDFYFTENKLQSYNLEDMLIFISNPIVEAEADTII